MKKHTVLLLLAMIITFTSACSGRGSDANGGVIKPNPEESKPEITILLSKGDEELMRATSIQNYIERFEERYGVEVKLTGIGSALGLYYLGNQVFTNEDVGGYSKELSAKMYQKDGPELLLYSFISLNALIKQNAALDAQGRISNLDKLHPGLVQTQVYYVPFALYHLPIVLNGSCVKELSLKEPDFSWTKEDYFNMKSMWLGRAKMEFSSVDFLDIISKHIFPLEIFSQDKSRVKINSSEMIGAVKSARTEIYNGNFQLNPGYSYQNYYNMLFEKQAEEYEKDRGLIRSDDFIAAGLRNIKQEYKMNALYAGDASAMFDAGNIVLPNVLEEKPQIFSHGFMLNKNGRNLELACEFVNGLIDDDVQLEIYQDQMLSLYPVNKNIEKAIREMEKNKGYNEKAIELSQYLLKQLEEGNADLSIKQDEKEHQVKWMLIKDLTKYIFADKEYSDEELSKELQKLEDKYNIWLSE